MLKLFSFVTKGRQKHDHYRVELLNPLDDVGLLKLFLPLQYFCPMHGTKKLKEKSKIWREAFIAHIHDFNKANSKFKQNLTKESV